MIKKLVKHLVPDEVQRLALVDGLGHDAWPALATLEERAGLLSIFVFCACCLSSHANHAFAVQMETPPTILCGTVVVVDKSKLGPSAADVLERISSATYEYCRKEEAQRRVEGFPNFSPVLAEMNEASAARTSQQPEYKCCSLHPSGALVIKECFYQAFEKDVEAFQTVVDEHNAVYNTDGIRLFEKAPVEEVAAVATPNKAAVMDGNPTAETLAGLAKACLGLNPMSSATGRFLLVLSFYLPALCLGQSLRSTAKSVL